MELCALLFRDFTRKRVKVFLQNRRGAIGRQIEF
jgi:hypothetical protein